MNQPRTDRALAVIALAAVLGFLAWRVLAHGILAIAPDDAEYIGVGRRLIAFRSPTGIDGTLFTIRSWVWPLAQGIASRLGPGDPFRGPQLLGVALGASALVGAVVFAYRRSGGAGALCVALVMMMTPVLWGVAASPRIDVALLALWMATVLIAAEPSPRRVVVAGLAAGLTMLVKETSAPLVLLPLAWWGAVPAAEWRRWAIRFAAAFALMVGWWFVVVLVLRGEVFPLEGLAQAAERALPRTWSLDPAALTMISAWVVGAIVLLVSRRGDVAIRVLLLATIAVLPATTIAWVDDLALRQFAPIALAGALILGLAISGVWTRGWAWAQQSSERRTVALVLAVVVFGAAIGPIVRVGTHVTVLSAPQLDRDLASWLDAHTSGPQTVAATFQFKAQTWARVGERVTFEGLRFENPRDAPTLAPMVWVDWSAGSFHALGRRELTRATRRAAMLEISGRHRLGPSAVATWLTKFGRPIGAVPAVGFGRRQDRAWIRVFALDHFDAARIPTVVTTAALERLSDAQVLRIGDVVIAGTRATLAKTDTRIRRLGGVAPQGLVAFPQ